MTAVIPESYPVVEQIAGLLDASVEQIIQQPQLLEQGRPQQSQQVLLRYQRVFWPSYANLAAIRATSLLPPTFREEVRELSDVHQE